ncbi:MAG: D-alanyl-D-alanine carboxypeptidase family protein [Candidatus Gracilibacteria bacterium]|jgi:D-alanyl-D-alanine carboxypeptidase
MIETLLSLYITAILQSNLDQTLGFIQSPPQSIIKTASYNLAQISENEIPPVKNPLMISPIIESKAGLAMDINSGTVLYEKNIHQRLKIASITKLMTIMIILEEDNLDEEVEVSANAAKTSGSVMYLKTNEVITIENLLYGALIHSANDAAIALAEHNSGSVDKFVEKMNDKALKLGLLNTHFSNPIGVDDKNNYSSAYDIAKLARYIYQKQFVKDTAQLKELIVYSKDKSIKHDLKSTNELLDSYLHIKGLKTGSTDGAGLCLVAIANDDSNDEILTVLLNSPNRFKETKILIDWVFRAYNWQNNK